LNSAAGIGVALGNHSLIKLSRNVHTGMNEERRGHKINARWMRNAAAAKSQSIQAFELEWSN
jgi:hypothetical protein